MRYWIIILSLLIVGCSKQEIKFTDDEIAYIKNTTIVVAVEENYYPFMFIENGTPNGFSKDLLYLIAEKAGITIIEKSSCQLQTCLEWLKEKEVSLVTSVRPTPERAEYSQFSRPYIYVGSTQIMASATPHSVGIGRGYAIKNYFINETPKIKIVEFDDDEEALKALKEGKVDSIAMDEISARYLKEKYKFEYFEAKIPHGYPLSFAVQKDNRILTSIFDKMITAIENKEMKEVKAKWKLN